MYCGAYSPEWHELMATTLYIYDHCTVVHLQKSPTRLADTHTVICNFVKIKWDTAVLHCLCLTDPFTVLSRQRYETLCTAFYWQMLTDITTLWYQQHETPLYCDALMMQYWLSDRSLYCDELIVPYWLGDTYYCTVAFNDYGLLGSEIQHTTILWCIVLHTINRGGHDELIMVIDLATLWLKCRVLADLATQDSLSLYCDATWENDYE